MFDLHFICVNFMIRKREMSCSMGRHGNCQVMNDSVGKWNDLSIEQLLLFVVTDMFIKVAFVEFEITIIYIP